MHKVAALFLACMLVLSLPLIHGSADGSAVQWTAEETAFLRDHPVIRLGVDPGFVPFEFIDEDGAYTGITADYLALITRKTGLRFEIVQGLTWPEAYDLALAGEIDALPAIGITEGREEHFLFSQPYYYFKRVIVTRDTDTQITGVKDLEGQIAAVQRNSSHHSYLLDYPKINLSLYDSVEAALAAVATGTENAFVGNLATTNYLIRMTALTNLRFVSFEAEKQQALYFAARKDWPELVSIFDKAMDSISQSEILAINKKWIDLDTHIDYGPLIRILAILAAAVLIVIAVSYFWITRLRKEIRQRKGIQKDLEQAKQAADEANEFKSSFMARMSHEIRTPLNAITGMAYLLKKTGLSLTQRMYTDRITQASFNMLSIINDILDFSKIEAGKVELDHASFSMDQVIQNVINIISYKIEEQEIGFRLSKDPLVPNWFLGDPKRLEQILLNVLNNAAKFTSKGEVSLDIRLIAKENGQYHLSFTIKDTGIGMDEEQVKKLFQPFIQGDTSINRRFGGSGLGLSIVKNLLDMMGGRIQVFSTPGEGSTFVIHLSFSVDKEKEDVYIRTLSGDHFKNVRTLVLEKTGGNINLIESYLGAFGMQCELTTSQTSAVSMLEAADGKFAKPFDLFIVDYETPLEGGFQFIQAMRNNKKIAKFPKVIMMLPMMREDLFDKLNEHGIDIGIGKPIIPSILFNGILDIFKLKALSASQHSQSAETEPVTLDETCCVLVAEDNKTNQMIAKSLLQQIGIETILASDGREAVELYGQLKDRIALVLMDLHMPVMNGYQAAEEIRKLSPDVPVIAMTADVVLGVKEKCAQSGIHQIISKPFDPDQFLQTIRGIIMSSKEKAVSKPKILDSAAGLRSMGGNIDIYLQVIREYCHENQETSDNLARAVSEQRYADAAQIVHKIKSSSGSIGAKSMHELSTKLQKSLDERKIEEVALLQKEFDLVLHQLLTEISLFEANKIMDMK